MMLEPTIGEVDFDCESGALRRSLHGSNAEPKMAERNIHDFGPMYKDMRFSASRTHDWALVNPGQRIIDTHFIFPLMKLAPSDPTHYYFDATDEAIRRCQELGVKVFYRLGTSIEHTKDRHFNALTPDDFHKYAEVLAGIIRHYTRGWANGFHYDIPYWEIWNEADLGSPMWSGALADYEKRFFPIVAKRLKSEFPELKIGGPAYTSFGEDKFDAFLDAAREQGVSPDFISWHYYGADARKLIAQPAAARKLLDAKGLTRTELCINEWHYLLTWEGLHRNITQEGYLKNAMGDTGLHGIDSAVFNLAVLSGWHDTPLNSAFYYGSGETGNWGFRTPLMGWSKNYYSMKLFGTVVGDYSIRVKTESSCDTLYLLGGLSEDRKQGCLLASDYRGDRNALAIALSGMEDAKISAVVLDSANDLTPVAVEREGNRLILRKNGSGSAAFLLMFQR